MIGWCIDPSLSGVAEVEARRARSISSASWRARRHRRRRLRRAVPGAGQPRLPGARRHADRARGDVPDVLAHGAITRLFEIGDLRAGETVLIHAAGSGVSVAAIQLAKHTGATVLATAGTDEKCERAAGARRRPCAQQPHRRRRRLGTRRSPTVAACDMVFDHVGTALFGPSLFALGIHGRLVSCGNSSGDQATIPSLGYLFHSGISITGSDPYRPEEFGPVWHTFCEQRFPVAIDSRVRRSPKPARRRTSWPATTSSARSSCARDPG